MEAGQRKKWWLRYVSPWWSVLLISILLPTVLVGEIFTCVNYSYIIRDIGNKVPCTPATVNEVILPGTAFVLFIEVLLYVIGVKQREKSEITKIDLLPRRRHPWQSTGGPWWVILLMMIVLPSLLVGKIYACVNYDQFAVYNGMIACSPEEVNKAILPGTAVGLAIQTFLYFKYLKRQPYIIR